MAISTSKDRTRWVVLNRVWDKIFANRDATGTYQMPLTLSNESILSVNNAGTGTVALIKSDASDAVTATNGLTIPTGKTLAITDGSGLTAGGIIVPTLIHGRWTGDAAQAVSRSISIARIAQKLVGANIVFGTASSSGTVTLEKLTGTTAPGSGTALFTGTLSTAGTANTVAPGVLSLTPADLVFAVGDRLGAVFSGTETGLVGLVVEFAFQKTA